MAERFDPYYVWLGVPPEERPTHAYRLLNLPLFESSPAVIENAIHQRVAYLQQQTTGPHGEEARRLLGELAQLRVLLLDPQRKAAYDAQLSAQQASARPVAANPPTPDAPLTNYTPSSVRSRRRPKRRKTIPPIVQILGGGLLGIALGYLVLIYAAPERDFLNLRQWLVGAREVAESDTDSDAGDQRPAKRASNDEAKASDHPQSDPRSSPPARPTTQQQPATPPKTTRSTPAAQSPATSEPAEGSQRSNSGSAPSNPEPSSQPETPIPDMPTLPPPDEDTGPLHDAPQAIALPPRVSQEIQSIISLPHVAESALEAKLLCDLAALDEGAAFVVQPIGADISNHWEIFYTAPDADSRVLVAQCAIENDEMQFQWLAEGSLDIADQLKNCVLRLAHDDETRHIALRKPIEADPLKLSLENTVSLEEISLGELPDKGKIYLEGANLSGSPEGAEFGGGERLASLGEALAIEFSGETGVEIELRLEERPTGLVLTVRPEVSLNVTSEVPFTLERLESMRSGAESAIKDTNSTLATRQRELASLQSRYASVARRRPSTAFDAVAKKSALDQLSSQIRVKSRSVKSLAKRRERVKETLAALPQWERMAKSLHEKLHLPLRIFAATPEYEVELYDAGFSAAFEQQAALGPPMSQ